MSSRGFSMSGRAMISKCSHKTDQEFRHPLMDWLLAQFHQEGDARTAPPGVFPHHPKAVVCHDTSTIAARMGCPQAVGDAARTSRAYRIVAWDLLQCAKNSGELVRVRDGWFVLPGVVL